MLFLFADKRQFILNKVIVFGIEILGGYQINIFKSTSVSEDIEKGFNLVAAHIDSPRLDLKQIPLYEDSNMAMFKTHYYGGIKKYQWTAIPLSLIGVVVLQDVLTECLVLGEDVTVLDEVCTAEFDDVNDLDLGGAAPLTVGTGGTGVHGRYECGYHTKDA